MESFKELRSFPSIKDARDETKFTQMLSTIYRRHANVVPMMAKGVAELRRELIQENSLLAEMPEIHQFLDGFYMSRIGIRILIGAPAALTLHPRRILTAHRVGGRLRPRRKGAGSTQRALAGVVLDHRSAYSSPRASQGQPLRPHLHSVLASVSGPGRNQRRKVDLFERIRGGT